MTTNDQLVEGVNELAESVAAMTVEAQMLRHEVRVVDKRNWTLAAVIGIQTLIIIGLILLGTTLNDVARKTNSNSDVLVECTTPSKTDEKHECYDRSLANQGKAVGNINLTSIFVAQCALKVPAEQLESCVEQKLTERAQEDK